MGSKGSATRRNIIEKALQLFSVKGYYNTSINDILTATGLTKGGLYGHFQSKEEVWYAVYDEAVAIWREKVFHRLRQEKNPLVRLEKFIQNDLRDYLGGDIFAGGCFFLNMLVELSGQSDTMSTHIVRGFIDLSRLLRSWLEEARNAELLKEGLNLKEIANFIMISLNGAASLYTSRKDPLIIEQTVNQLLFYINQLKQ